MRTLIIVTCAAVALAGCGRTPPHRKAGLWSETIVRDGHKAEKGLVGSVKVCIGPSTDVDSPIFSYAAAVKLAKARNCRGTVAHRGLAGAYHFGSTCPLPGDSGTVLTKGTASGDFTAHYRLTIESVTTHPAPFTALNSHHEDVIDANWLGPCPPGLAPGDMMLPSGLKLPGGRMVDPHRSPRSAP